MVGDLRSLRRAAWAFKREVSGVYLLRAGQYGLNPDGAQCINVPLCFLERLGLQGPPGNASDWVGLSIQGLDWLSLSDLNAPRVGDVLVFDPSRVGSAGHVSVCLYGRRSPLRSLDENWPLGSPCGVVLHSQADLAGVQRPRLAS